MLINAVFYSLLLHLKLWYLRFLKIKFLPEVSVGAEGYQQQPQLQRVDVCIHRDIGKTLWS